MKFQRSATAAFVVALGVAQPIQAAESIQEAQRNDCAACDVQEAEARKPWPERVSQADQWQEWQRQQEARRQRARQDLDWDAQQQDWERRRAEWLRQQEVWRQTWELQDTWQGLSGDRPLSSWQGNSRSSNAATPLYSSTRLDLISATNDWVTVTVEGLTSEQELTFTGRNSRETLYLPAGTYRIRFRPTLSSNYWESGYLVVGRTSTLQIVFSPDQQQLRINEDPQAWTPERR